MADDLKKLLTSGSVALVGVSEREGSVARPILLGLANFFKGEILLVNPARETLLGMECLPSVAAIPWLVDLAVVVVGAPLVPDTIEEMHGTVLTDDIRMLALLRNSTSASPGGPSASPR